MTPRALWLDINETLIRTGSVPLALRLAEQVALERVRELAAALAAARPLSVVLVTGNSFEYARRVEEPLALRALPGVTVDVIAEGGLVCRSLSGGGGGWVAAAPAAWRAAAAAMRARVDADPALRGRVFEQGNEVRVTWKPVADQHDPATLAGLIGHARAVGLPALGGLDAHPLWLDLWPGEVEVGGAAWPSPDKGGALRRWLGDRRVDVRAVGDSAGDTPMFELAVSLGGEAWVVANGTADGPWRRAVGAFTAGVVEVMTRWVQAGSG